MNSPLAQLRPALAADVPTLKAIAAQAYQPYVARIGRKPAPMVADFARHVEAGEVIVAMIASEVIGYLVGHHQGDTYFIENVAVDPGHHGQGIGGQLISAAETAAQSAGHRRMQLYTNEKMTEMLSYYPARGYRETERRCEDGFNRVYFERPL